MHKTQRGIIMTKVSFSQDKSTLTVHLAGEIDHHGAASVRAGIDSRILKAMPKVVILDFSQVTFMDSSGVGLVLARHKLCRDCGASVYVSGVDRSTGRILSLAGIRTIQNIQI